MSKNIKNNFLQIDKNLADNFCSLYGTPIYIMDEKGLLDRFRAFKNAVKNRYSHSLIAISYKTNFLKGLLTLLHREGAHAEVVSGIEYSVAKEIKLNKHRIIFNGPMKTEHELIEAINDNAIINCDHEDEIIRVEKIAKDMKRKISIGIRIYFPKENTVWNRFGFAVSEDISDKETISIIKKINNSSYLKLAGLHAHIGTNIRDLTHYSRLSYCLCKFATQLKNKFNIELDWLDVGGGLAGISPYITENQTEPHSLPDVEAYAKAVIDPLLPYVNSLSQPPILIFEPGRTIFEAHGALLTKVVGRRQNHSEKIHEYICDAGTNALATSYVYDFPIHTFKNLETYKKSKLLGPTCNQQDQLHTPILLPSLNLGDLVLFYGVGSYCMAFGYSFIRFKPGVILWRGENKSEWLQKPETLDHRAKLECIPSDIL